MKKCFIGCFLLFCFFTAVLAQQDTAIKFSKYVGTFYTGSYDNEGVQTKDITFRIGGDAVLPVFERVTLNTWLGYEAGPATKGCSFGKFFFERKSPVINAGLGYMPRPIAIKMKPHPLSADGHFCPPALQAIPALETGACVGRKLWNEGPELIMGVFYLAPSQSTDRAAEWNVSLDQDFGLFNVIVAGYTSPVRSGIAAKVKTEDLSLTMFATNDSVFTAHACYQTRFGDPYVNMNYNRSARSFDDLQFGLTKTFSMPYFGAKMLIGAAYWQHNKSTAIFLQLYL